MGREVNGKPIRGERSARYSRMIEPHESHKISTSVLVLEAGHYNIHSDVEETPADYIVPTSLLDPKRPTVRRSLTASQHLGLFPQDLEFEPLPGKQLLWKRDIYTGKMSTDGELIEVNTQNRMVWKSDRTLLRTEKVDKDMQRFWRKTSRSKRTILEDKEIPAVVEVSTETDLDDTF